MKIAEAFYDRLIGNTRDHQRATSLQRIRIACDSVEQTMDEYTVADVGRYCVERWGGPKAQSIRNSPSVLMKYIRLRIAEHRRGAGSPGVEHADDRTLDLSDPADIQHRFLIALGEIEHLKREILRLRLRLEGYGPGLVDELISITNSSV
jgi:hypothetical protein